MVTFRTHYELVSPQALVTLALGNNQLSGDLPREFGQLLSLRRLHLFGNTLDGEIPPTLGRCSALQELCLHRNRLTGSIPPELGDLRGK